MEAKGTESPGSVMAAAAGFNGELGIKVMRGPNFQRQSWWWKTFQLLRDRIASVRTF